MPCKPCTMDYSKGYGTGVADALGNWGFSSQVANPGNELNRMVCLFKKMDDLKEGPKCCPPPKRYINKPVCMVPCRPKIENCCTPRLLPLITYCGVSETFIRNNRRLVYQESLTPSFGRHSVYQGNDKWYKLGPLCCPQPCCPAPVCPQYPVCYDCPSCC